MRSIQTSFTFPLSSVKPLEELLSYRTYCIARTERALRGKVRYRDRSPVTDSLLEPFGQIDGLSYGRCPDGGGFFLLPVPDSCIWAELLADVNRYRLSPKAFHSSIAQFRTDNVYLPKLEWIQETLRLQNLFQPKILEVSTPPAEFTQLLIESGSFSDVVTADEMKLVMASDSDRNGTFEAAVLLESLDRVDDSAALIRHISGQLVPGGLIFVTALVSSGFDIAVLGVRNRYLYPPDRTNCFTLDGLSRFLKRSGFTLLEVSTPGVLDLEIVQAHVQHDPSLLLTSFERQLLTSDEETRAAFQAFLQQQGLSSFARIVARKSA